MSSIKTYKAEFVYTPRLAQCDIRNKDFGGHSTWWFYSDRNGNPRFGITSRVFPEKKCLSKQTKSGNWRREYKIHTLANGGLHKIANSLQMFIKNRGFGNINVSFEYDVVFEEDKLPQVISIHDIYFVSDQMKTYKKTMKHCRVKYDS